MTLPNTVADVLRLACQWRNAIAFTVAAAAGFLLLSGLPGYFKNNSTVLVLDMAVSSGTRLEVYVNRNFSEPLVGKLVPGQRQQYRLEGLINDIRSLRIDPGESPGAAIALHGMWTEDSDGSFGHVPASSIARWASANVTPRGLVDGAARFTATSNDPMLFGEPNITLRSSSPPLIAAAIHMLAWPRTATLIVIGAGFLVLLSAAAFNPTRIAHPILAFVCGGLTVLSITGFATFYQPLAPIHTAVGRAGFHGLSTTPGVLGVLFAALLSAIAAAAFAYFHRGATPAPTPVPEPGPLRTTINRLGVVVVLLAGFLFFFPVFEGALQYWLTYQAAPDWDGNNVLIWNYLTHAGDVPLRDFWYPYAGQYRFNLPAPEGMLTHGAFLLAVFGLTFYGIYRLSGRNLAIAAFAAAALVIGDTIAVYWGSARYLQALSIAMVYLAIDDREDRIQPAHLCFWAACCLSLYFEPAQTAYAAPAVLAKILLDIALNRPFDRMALLRRMIRDFTVPTIFLLTRLGIVGVGGGMSHYADFYFGLGDQAAASAQPADLAGDAVRPLRVQFLIIVAPMVMIGIGLYDRLRAGRAGSLAGDSLVLLGLVGMMILQKHLVRPADWQLLVIPALGLLACAAAPGRRSIVERAAAGAVFGAYAAAVVLSGALPGHWLQLAGGPSRVANYLFTDALPIDEANDQRFAPHHFDRFTDETAIAARIRALSPPNAPARTYVLTDNQVIYILLGQKPPYHSNLYNSSPIYEQRKVLDWLAETRPAFAVLDPQKLIFDTFQTAIRTPLIFNHIVENYVPQETVGSLSLLRRRKSDEPIAIAFWRDALSSKLDYGHFPRASTARARPTCATGSECQDFLKVTIADASPSSQRRTVPFKAGGLDFTASFVAVAAQHEYFLSLDRIWFWDVLRRNGISVEVDTTALPQGVSAETVRLSAGPHILY